MILGYVENGTHVITYCMVNGLNLLMADYVFRRVVRLE